MRKIRSQNVAFGLRFRNSILYVGVDMELVRRDAHTSTYNSYGHAAATVTTFYDDVCYFDDDCSEDNPNQLPMVIERLMKKENCRQCLLEEDDPGAKWLVNPSRIRPATESQVPRPNLLNLFQTRKTI